MKGVFGADFKRRMTFDVTLVEHLHQEADRPQVSGTRWDKLTNTNHLRVCPPPCMRRDQLHWSHTVIDLCLCPRATDGYYVWDIHPRPLPAVHLTRASRRLTNETNPANHRAPGENQAEERQEPRRGENE